MTTISNGRSTLEHRVGHGGEVSVGVHAGEVTVRGVHGDTVAVRDLDGRDLRERFHIEAGDGRLVVRPHDRTGFDLRLSRPGRGRARLEIDLPAEASLSLDGASADLHTTGLRGEQRLRTASGSVALADVAGTISLDAVSGDVRIDAVGDLDLSGRVVSGDLVVHGGSLRTLALATTSGDVTLEAPLIGPGPYSLQTVSGDAHVVSGPGGLRVEAKTLTGRISSDTGDPSDRGPGRRMLVVGPGAATFSFRSISGDLHIAQAEARGATPSHVAPEPPAPPDPPTPSGRADAVHPGEAAEDARLAVLRELEAGTIDVATATERLAALEDESRG